LNVAPQIVVFPVGCDQAMPLAAMITIVPYMQEWPHSFATEAKRIRAKLVHRALRIDHVGSTSVAGLAAKAVIDIQISVASLEPRGPLLGDMQTLGYTHVDVGDGFDLIYPFFKRPAEWPSSHHVHLCEAGGEQERRHLAFRDYLRRHDSVAAEYLELKRELARIHGGESAESRERYALAKSDFVEQILVRAFAEGLPEFGRSDG
jgi:GrpB-like predicted nucleotidyltransferase (UPF0157 family)